MSRTQTREAPATVAKPVISSGRDIVLVSARLPYYDEIKTRYDIDNFGWHTIVDAVFPSALTIEGVIMGLEYCRVRKLDPFKKTIHVVPTYSSAHGKMIETVWPGIAEIRITAHRTKNYAGVDAVESGQIRTIEYSGTVEEWIYDEAERKRVKRTAKRVVKITRPDWMRYTVYRIIGGLRCAFVGPKVLFDEAYAPISRFEPGLPNSMWTDRPDGQLDKCAEAAALRRAFPEEIGNEYAAEEMAGKTIGIELERTLAGDRRVNVVEGTATEVEAKVHEAPDPDEVEGKVEAVTDIDARLAEDTDDADFESVIFQSFREAFEKLTTVEALKKNAEDVKNDPDLTDEERIAMRAHYDKARDRLKAAGTTRATSSVDEYVGEKVRSQGMPVEHKVAETGIPGLAADKTITNEDAFYEWARDQLAAAETAGEMEAFWTNVILPIDKDPAFAASLEMMLSDERALRDGT